ncbi:MAG: pyridoxal-phosphate dependent enzyme [Bacteroidales bacterium]
MEYINITNGWIKVSKKELDELRHKTYDQYRKDGGCHKFEDFNTHLPNYEELIEIIEKKLAQFQEKGNKRILIDGNWFQNISPGKTFLKHFFHTKKNEPEAQFQRININLCYIYAFGETREDIIMKTKGQSETSEELVFDKETDAKPEFILSYTYNNINEARKIETFLNENFGAVIKSDIRNSPLFQVGPLQDLYNNLSDNQFIIKLFGRDYFQNEECVEELIYFTRNNFPLYRKKSINIILSDIYDGEYNIFSTLGKIALSLHWKLHIEKLEKAFSEIIGVTQDLSFSEDKMLGDISDKVDRLKIIKKEMFEMLQKLTSIKSTIRYDIFFDKIKSTKDLLHLLPKFQVETASPVERIYQSIQVPSNNNPQKPEFPPKPFFTPSFPASNTYQIEIPGFTNVWLKDESTNPTGTHKDRFAWEVIIKYKALLESTRHRPADRLPQISMISSGGAATAVQNLFNLFDIPVSLKVLLDEKTDQNIKKSLQKIGCTIYETNLSEVLLQPEEIKRITENWDGIDITYRETLDPNLDNYYDWLSYEIINQDADYCFIPFGTGDLFINVLNIVKKEYFNSFLHNPDPRYSGSIEKLKNCHYLGATTKYKDSKLDKLYSSFLPTFDEYLKFIKELISYSCVGDRTSIKQIQESFVIEAIELAKSQNLTFEPSGIAGIALLLQVKDHVPSDSKILIVNTGKTKSAEELLKLMHQFKENNK